MTNDQAAGGSPNPLCGRWRNGSSHVVDLPTTARLGGVAPSTPNTIPFVATAPKPSELDLARIRRWVEARVPVESQGDVRLEMGVRGANVTIFELRPPGCEEVGPDWSRRPLAQLRSTGYGFWLLLWQNRRDQWERYPLAPNATRDLDALLRELDEDSICVFGL